MCSGVAKSMVYLIRCNILISYFDRPICVELKLVSTVYEREGNHLLSRLHHHPEKEEFLSQAESPQDMQIPNVIVVIIVLLPPSGCIATIHCYRPFLKCSSCSIKAQRTFTLDWEKIISNLLKKKLWKVNTSFRKYYK